MDREGAAVAQFCELSGVNLGDTNQSHKATKKRWKNGATRVESRRWRVEYSTKILIA
jgi:hypothetical protein